MEEKPKEIKKTQLTDEKIKSNTMAVVWPAVAESLFVGLVGMIDTMMVGNLGPAAIAAVGLTAQPKFIGLAIFMSFNSAVASVVARRYGERSRDDANNILVNGMVLVCILTAIISFLYVKFSYGIVKFMQGDEITTALASDYLKIIMGGLIFSTGTFFINACQRGIGNTKITFKTNLVSNVINVILNYLLIEGHLGFPRLEIKGAAIATVIGSAAGFVMALCSVLKKGGFLYLFTHVKIGFYPKTVSSLSKVGTSALAEQACMRFGFLIFTLTVSSLGTNSFAANQIGMNISMISFSFGDGMSSAVLALVGRSMGEKDVDLAKKYIKCCLKIGRTATIFTSIIFFFFGRQLFLMFTDEPEVLSYAVFISAVLGLTTILQIPAMVFAGALRGAGDAMFIAVTSLVCIGLIRSFFSWFLTYPMGLGLYGAWMGFFTDQAMRFVLNYTRFRKGRWERISL